MDGFLQDPPTLGNQYADDEFLRSQLRRALPADCLQLAESDLGEDNILVWALSSLSTHFSERGYFFAESFGWEVATSIKKLGFQAEVSSAHDTCLPA